MSGHLNYRYNVSIKCSKETQINLSPLSNAPLASQITNERNLVQGLTFPQLTDHLCDELSKAIREQESLQCHVFISLLLFTCCTLTTFQKSSVVVDFSFSFFFLTLAIASFPSDSHRALLRRKSCSVQIPPGVRLAYNFATLSNSSSV